MMSTFHRLLLLALPALWGLSGCVNSLPEPLEPLHAVFSEEPRTSLNLQQPYDAIIMVSVSSCDEYAAIKKGDWVTTWSLCKLKTLQVLKGKVPESTLNIRDDMTLPTPESGRMLSVEQGPLQTGNLLALWLDTTVKPYQVVFVQERQPQDKWTGMAPAVNLKITEAVEAYLNYPPMRLDVLGQADDHYIVTDGARKMAVNKTTWVASGIRDE